MENYALIYNIRYQLDTDTAKRLSQLQQTDRDYLLPGTMHVSFGWMPSEHNNAEEREEFMRSCIISRLGMSVLTARLLDYDYQYVR